MTPPAGDPATGRATTLCPLCGKEFPSDRSDCHSGCPIAGHCRVLCCPGCGYEFVEHSAVASGVGKVVRWIRSRK